MNNSFFERRTDTNSSEFDINLVESFSNLSKKTDEIFIEQQIGTNLEVHGYRILLKAVKIPETTRSGLYVSESYRNQERRAYNIGLVLKMGPIAYHPLEKFGGKPYCSVGDWVVYSAYERDEVNINGHLCYFINDERIYATIPDITTIVKDLEVLNYNG